MSLSELTGATVEQVEAVLVELEAVYRLELKLLREKALAVLKGQNAVLRKSFAVTRKKLELYRNALRAEGPGDGN